MACVNAQKSWIASMLFIAVFIGGAETGAVLGGIEAHWPGMVMRRQPQFEVTMKERRYWW